MPVGEVPGLLGSKIFFAHQWFGITLLGLNETRVWLEERFGLLAQFYAGRFPEPVRNRGLGGMAQRSKREWVLASTPSTRCSPAGGNRRCRRTPPGSFRICFR